MDIAFPYDGDTLREAKINAREKARIVVSNPHGIHKYLDTHHLWTRFYGNLKYVIIDEVHEYRGVFGSNVALLLRRLQRVCEIYASKPQFILLSATIANPKEHAEKLVGKKFTVINNDGAPRHKKHF